MGNRVALISKEEEMVTALQRVAHTGDCMVLRDRHEHIWTVYMLFIEFWGQTVIDMGEGPRGMDCWLSTQWFEANQPFAVLWSPGSYLTPVPVKKEEEDERQKEIE